MKNKLLLLVVLVLCLIYSFNRSSNQRTSFFSDEHIIAVKDTKNDKIEKYDVENYLIGVLAGEMPASFSEEALKAQAIASRTFAYYKISTSDNNYDLTNDTTSQVHITNEQMKEKWQKDYDFYLAKIKKAISDTRNLVLTYNGGIIASYYFAMSNGFTEDGILVFNENKDYLQSVSSLENEQTQNFLVTKTISKEEFCNRLNIVCDEIKIENIERSKTNRVNLITINGKEYKGTDIRSLLNLRSTDFEINISDNIEITTKGYGHGVGMSQYGANLMAEKGYNYKDILKHYYVDTQILNINDLKV